MDQQHKEMNQQDKMEFAWYGNKFLPVYKEGRKVICYGGIGMLRNK